MNAIKFSHDYPKLHGPTSATLLAVVPIRIDRNTPKELIEYDTTYYVTRELSEVVLGVGTATEQKRRFGLHCLSLDNRCAVCPLFKEVDCKLAWAQLPYESEAAK